MCAIPALEGTAWHGMLSFAPTGSRHPTHPPHRQAYLSVAPNVACFPEYLEPLAWHLLRSKLRHWEKSLRELAAQALAGVCSCAGNGGGWRLHLGARLLLICIGEQSAAVLHPAIWLRVISCSNFMRPTHPPSPQPWCRTAQRSSSTMPCPFYCRCAPTQCWRHGMEQWRRLLSCCRLSGKHGTAALLVGRAV